MMGVRDLCSTDDDISEDANERSLIHIKIACDFVASLAEDKYDVLNGRE